MPPALQPQMQPSLPDIYEEYVTAGKLIADDAQRAIVGRLEALRQTIAKRQASLPAQPKGKLSKWLASPASPASPAPRSLYIWGDVGRGKSLLMDMFYLFSPPVKKRRVHFHAFMAEIHARVHKLRRAKGKGHENPVEQVAEEMARKHDLLCLDEFQVTDVADAMILHKFFTTQFAMGVTFILTSNRPPQDLYKGGLQREKFLDFVRLAQERMDIMELAAQQDYRLQQIRSLRNVYLSVSDENEMALKDAYAALTHQAQADEMVLEVHGRKLTIRECSGGVARFTFRELCGVPLGAADYIAIARQFHTVIISHIPCMSSDNRNEARRFITLIDALYDRYVKLLCTAEAEPDKLYQEGDGSFEFRRTASRLIEMQTENYLAYDHLP